MVLQSFQGKFTFQGDLVFFVVVLFFTFYFEITLDSCQSYKIVQRVPVYPPPNSPQC